MATAQEVAMWKNVCKKPSAQKKKVTKREKSRNQFEAEKLLMMTQVGTLAYYVPEVLEVGIFYHLQMKEEAIQTLQQIETKLILPLYRYCHHRYH